MRNTEKNKELHMIFVDLEKAYDRVPRELIWWSMRQKNVPEAFIKIIQVMYEDCETQVTTREGNTEYCNVKVGLHQGSQSAPYSSSSSLMCSLLKSTKNLLGPCCFQTT